jgi:O-antigen ligase
LNGLAGFYMVQAYLADDRGSRRFAMAMAVAGIFPIGTGLYEIVTGNHWSIVYGESGLVRNVGMYHDAITPRYYAMQTILALLVLTGLYRSRRWLANLASVLYGGACAVVVFFAYSKSGALTLASWSLVWAGLMRRGRVLGLIAVLGLGAAVTFNDTVTDRLGTVFNKEIGVLRGETATDRSFAGRWYIWFDLIDEWQRQDSTQQIFGSGRSALGAHNDYLQILMHGGLVGLALYLLLLLTLLGAVLRDLLQRRDAWTVAALLAMIMWLVDTIGLIPSAYSNYQWFVWGVIGLSMRRMRDERSASRSRVAAANAPPVFGSQHECQPSISAL